MVETIWHLGLLNYHHLLVLLDECRGAGRDGVLPYQVIYHSVIRTYHRSTLDLAFLSLVSSLLSDKQPPESILSISDRRPKD